MKVGDLVIHIYSKRIGVVFKVWLNYCWVHFEDGKSQHSIKNSCLEKL